ncbi:MAG TPA: cytochrome c3 family protein [Anaerolineales bacterium]|nr:cytochrome c3 family protein [Anaerolineales bacterium]
MNKKKLLVITIIMLLGVFLVSCSQAPAPTAEVTPCPTSEPCPDCPTCPEPPPPPEPVVKEVPFEEAWASSPHNDAEAEAFVHWDEDDPAEVPASCATCHSTQGYQDFLGLDNSEVGKVDANVPAPAGTIQCVACHNSAAASMDSVTFPSGVSVSNLGSEARCMVCHQGRASKAQVDAALEKFGVVDDLDVVPESVEDSNLGFINIHYFAAASTLYGTTTQGGYEYEGKSYDTKNEHVAGYDTCIGCHDSHTLELKVDQCASCHQDVGSAEDVSNIRMAGSITDYDGDGDITEGVADEIDGLRELLYQAIQSYASEVPGSAIVYNQAEHPYFFIDSNADGRLGNEDTERYTTWTGRLLKAAYNYQVATKDPGAYAHGGKYIIQLLYDSIEDLNTMLATPVDLSTAQRIDNGHFAGSEEAFRHWDGEEDGGIVESGCAKCHSAAGLPLFLKEGVNISQPASNGLNCATCHDDVTTFTRFMVNEVTFPSGAKISFGEANDNNLCINCHQGRESKLSVDSAISAAGVGDDETSESLRFRNPHYFAAGATLFGADAMGAYMYDNKEYDGKDAHVQGFDTCSGCHDAHALSVKAESCTVCHPVVQTEADIRLIRITTGDFDGDGDETEGLAGEIDTLAEKLFAAIQAYATENELPAIAYDAHRYPYWFADLNENGVVDGDDTGYATWTPRLLKAAYNYQWTLKDPGAFAHNGTFMIQVLYDSIEDIGGDLTGMVRPAVIAP